MSFGPPPAAGVRPDGTFTLTRLLDATVLRLIEVRPPWYVKAVRYKGADVTDVPTEFTDLADPKQLEVVVASRGARLRVRVSNGQGEPAEGLVLLFAADPRLRHQASTMSRGDGIGRDGTATLEGLRPGTYLAVAFDPRVTAAGRQGQELFEHLAPFATRVELLENDSREISLTIVTTSQ